MTSTSQPKPAIQPKASPHRSNGGVHIYVTGRGARYVEVTDLLNSESAQNTIKDMAELSKRLKEKDLASPD